VFLLSLAAAGLCFNITFVNNCKDSLNVCDKKVPGLLAPGKTAIAVYDAKDSTMFRVNCTGKTVASTFPDPYSPLTKYQIDARTYGFDVAMQIKPMSGNSLTLTCKSADCAGTYWFGGEKTVLFDATSRDTDFTLTYCP
ncbi:hypothetical protein PENTCL1PPCAC_15186, partial [Pristionchus entomophagus]